MSIRVSTNLYFAVMSSEKTAKTDEKYFYYVENKTFELVTANVLTEEASIVLTFLDAGGSPNGWFKLSGTSVTFSCDNKTKSSTSDSHKVAGIFRVFKTPKRIELSFQSTLFENYTYSSGCDLEDEAFGFAFLTTTYPKHTAKGLKFKIKSKFIVFFLFSQIQSFQIAKLLLLSSLFVL
jgi:hypothetical protein